MNTSNKTLLQILIEELPKRGGWPVCEQKLGCVQDRDCEIKFHYAGYPLTFGLNNPGNWGSTTEDAWLLSDRPGCNITNCDTLANDYTTAIITRDQYEAALFEAELTDAVQDKPDADGWIAWAGGECPVSEGTLVDVRYRCGEECHHVGANVPFDKTGSASGWCAEDWSHSNESGDIIAYRPHQPQEANSRANDDRLETDLNECIGQTPEDVDAIRADILGVIRDTRGNISISDAFEIAEMLIDAGYRKQ